jgi:DNA invertase Pin-like site-specific DNA recombinase
MFTEAHQKVTALHLARDAYLYVRQSSLRQVMENTESTQRQYALRERAVALGWSIEQIHVIDSDLGRSGAQCEGRDGFQHLVTQVALGQVGIVLGLEVSRLARNNADWHRLLELSALSNTLILDEDGIYDPAHFNDRLLLGLKGTMSEAELHVLKARLQGGMLNKARRGELKLPLPIGLVYRPDGVIALDPDRQIEQSLRLLFKTFGQVGSAMAVVKRFRAEGLDFPRRIRRGIGKGEVHWGALNHSRVIQILHNPRYAGAFVYGRTRSGRTADLRSTTLKVARDDWMVLIPDAHIGYIGWEEYERNQATLQRNAGGFAKGRRGSVPREGVGLLQGRVICGLCGARMRVRYQQVGGKQEPYYQCTEASVRDAGKLCQSIRGRSIDKAISALLLEIVSPAALDVALAVQDEIADRIHQADTVRAAQLERVRYEAELARRRYLKVDPDNRLVADTLEADWNERLRQLDALQCEQDRQRETDRVLLATDARQRIASLTKDFPRVWNDPRTTPVERKRMVALLLEDATLIKGDEIKVHLRFRGGKTHSLTVPRPLPMARIRKTPDEVVRTLDQLLETCTDREAAECLNELGYRNWQGQAFTIKKVAIVRRSYGLKSRYERLRARGLLTGPELAAQLGVSSTTVHTWGRQGLLQREIYGSTSRCLYKPLGSMIPTKGSGGRRPTPPKLINVSTSTQEIV